MSVSPLVAAHSSARTQKEATTVAVFLGTLWNRTSIPARPLVRGVLFICLISLSTVHSVSFQLHEMIVCFILHIIHAVAVQVCKNVYLFPTNCTFCWLTFTVLTLHHLLANNSSHAQGEHWHSFMSAFSLRMLVCCLSYGVLFPTVPPIQSKTSHLCLSPILWCNIIIFW